MKETKKRKAIYVQLHDAFTPLQMAPVLSLGMKGEKAMKSMIELDHGIDVTHKSGRRFVVPFANIAFYEIEAEEKT
jgi:hypothetical protein